MRAAGPSEESVPPELARAVKERRAILFAGAGLSMNVGLPSWQDLINRMGEEIGTGHREFAPARCQLSYTGRVLPHPAGQRRSAASWMDRNWKVSGEKVRASKMHALIVELNFPIIYTTNYDRNLEAAFAAHRCDFVKVANARDIAKTRKDVAQIVKFHGDFDDDDSLVITETDYFNRLAFDSALDIKFQSDALGKTVLFIGYSMTDLNIRLLLRNLWRTWQTSGYAKDRPKSFLFMARPNPMQKAILE